MIGPGSLFTSIVPNLLVPGMPEAIAKSRGKVVLVANLVTQPGETDGFDLERHVEAIRDLGGLRRLDFILVHDGPIPAEVEERYRASGAEVLRVPPGGGLAARRRGWSGRISSTSRTGACGTTARTWPRRSGGSAPASSTGRAVAERPAGASVRPRQTTVVNKQGWHARPAAMVVKCANGFQSDVTISINGLVANGKSMMDVIMLASPCGSVVTLGRDGPDAEACADAHREDHRDGLRRGARVSPMKVFRGHQRLRGRRGRRGARPRCTARSRCPR